MKNDMQVTAGKRKVLVAYEVHSEIFHLDITQDSL